MSKKISIKKLINECKEKTNKDVDPEALEWVLNNEQILTERFKKEHPRSSYRYAVKIPTKKNYVIFDSKYKFKRPTDGYFIEWLIVKRMGCVYSYKNRIIK